MMKMDPVHIINKTFSVSRYAKVNVIKLRARVCVNVCGVVSKMELCICLTECVTICVRHI